MQKKILNIFFNLEKRNYINKTIQQLINDKGDTITDFKEVFAEERSFKSFFILRTIQFMITLMKSITSFSLMTQRYQNLVKIC